MAARDFTYMQALEKEVKLLFGSVVIGSTGAVGTVKGDFSITRNSIGNYTIVLQDKYNRMLGSTAGFVQGTANTPTGVFKVEISSGAATLQADQKSAAGYQITCYDAAEAPVDPVAGSVMSIMWMMRNTTVTVGND